MKASDLPFSVKQKILDEVRRRVGEESYQRMASELSEDRVLDLFLEKSASLATGKQESARPGCLAEVLAGLLANWWLWIPLFIGAVGGERAGEVAMAICLGLLLLSWLARTVFS